MSSNVAAVRSVPGRSLDGNHCRHCNEKESLAHVLGYCSWGYQLRILRHNKMRSIIASELKSHGWTVFEEVDCIADQGSTRRIDILAFNKSKKGYIIDPTIRFESNNPQHASDVDIEKRSIYEPCVDYIENTHNLTNIEVIGLLVGARGCLSKFFDDFCQKFKLKKGFAKRVSIEAMKGSIKILHNHLYR